MQEENVAPQEVQEQVVEQPQEQQIVEEQPQEQVDTSTPEQEEVTQEPVSEAATPEEPKQTEDYGIDYSLTNFLQPQPQAPQFTPDEDGFVDPNQFYNKILADAEARIEQKLAFQESERRAWQSIENKYPEIKEDPELRDIVNAQRLADVARGGKGDLNAIAGKVLGKIQSYQSKGKAQAQVSEKVQKSASLQKNTSNSVETSRDDDLLDRMSSGDSNAADELISQWLESGKL